jgi:hypothetical protein
LTEQVQYFSTGTAGTDFNIASAVNTHTFNLPTASATNRGALSSADWITFNSKANASGTTNYVSKFTGTTTLGNSQIFDNGTNVGIGTTSPIHPLSVVGRIGGNIFGDSHIEFLSNGNTSLKANNNVLIGYSQTTVVTQGGNVGIGTSGPSAKLNVYGDLHLGSYSNLSTVNFENRTGKGIFVISTNGVTNAEGTTITYSWADGGHGPLKFNNASSEVMRLSANGNVGIGTITPLKLLDVNGDALINTLTVGKGAGNQIYNTVLGYQALGGNTTGNENVAIGYQALLANSTGGTNVGIGVAALKLNETGGDNTAVGTVALFNNITGSGNTAIGYSTLNASVDGYANTNIGYSCGALAGSPIGTTLIGYNLKYRPSTSSDPLSDSDFAISQYWNEYPGKPHFYAPNKIVIGASTNTEILSVSWDAYNAFFVDYSFDDASGNLRAGTIKCIFASVGGTFYYELTDDVTPDIGTTTNLSFDVIDDGSHNAVLRVINSDAATYIRFTSRLLFKTI